MTDNFDWNRARAFLATAEHGSLSAAARALGTTQPTVGRQVAALEAQLGVTLFDRVGNQLTLTSTGLDLVEHVRAMRDAADRVALTATGQALSVEGTVMITASEAISAFLLPPILAKLRVDYPGIELEIVPANDRRDLRRREADIAVRNFRSEQPDLIGRKVRDSTGWFYAAPSYLERVGPIETVEDIKRVELIAFDRSRIMIDGLKHMGIEVSKEQFTIVVDNHLVQWELCKQGAGVAMMMDEVGAAEPGVVRLLDDHPPITFPIWVMSHRQLRTSRRIRVVFDALVEGLA